MCTQRKHMNTWNRIQATIATSVFLSLCMYRVNIAMNKKNCGRKTKATERKKKRNLVKFNDKRSRENGEYGRRKGSIICVYRALHLFINDDADEA